MSENSTNDLTVQEMLLFHTARQAALLEQQRQMAKATIPPHPQVQPWDQLLSEAIAAAYADVCRFSGQQSTSPDS